MRGDFIKDMRACGPLRTAAPILNGDVARRPELRPESAASGADTTKILERGHPMAQSLSQLYTQSATRRSVACDMLSAPSRRRAARDSVARSNLEVPLRLFLSHAACRMPMYFTNLDALGVSQNLRLARRYHELLKITFVDFSCSGRVLALVHFSVWRWLAANRGQPDAAPNLCQRIEPSPSFVEIRGHAFFHCLYPCY